MISSKKSFCSSEILCNVELKKYFSSATSKLRILPSTWLSKTLVNFEKICGYPVYRFLFDAAFPLEKGSGSSLSASEKSLSLEEKTYIVESTEKMMYNFPLLVKVFRPEIEPLKG